MLCQMQALGQMSLLPARRLEKFCPGMRRKGRVCLGGDADIVVFDAATVRALHVYIYISPVHSRGVVWHSSSPILDRYHVWITGYCESVSG